MEATKTPTSRILERSGALISFLVIELLFFIGLSINPDGIYIRILSVLLAAVGLSFVINDFIIGKRRWIDLLIVSVPLVVYGLLSVISPYFNGVPIIDSMSYVLAFLAVFLLGYSMSNNRDFNIEYALIALFAGVGLLVFVSLTVSFINYGFFYITRYAGKVVYYGGQFYSLSNQVKWLNGFEMKDVVINTASFYLVILASLLLPAILSFKTIKNKIVRYSGLGLGILGALSIILLPSIKAAILLLPSIALVLLVNFYPKNDKVLKIIVYVGLALIGVIAFISGLWAFRVAVVVNILNSNPLTSMIYNHPFVIRWGVTIRESMSYFFGTTAGFAAGELSTRNFILDTLRQAGWIATLAIIVFLAFSIKQTIGFIRDGTDSKFTKLTIVSLLTAFFTYSLIAYPHMQFVTFSTITRNSVSPFIQNGMWLVALFLFGYVSYFPLNTKPNNAEVQ